MKRFITILMMALCLVAFTTGDAQAKVRKKTHKARTTKTKMIEANMLGVYDDVGYALVNY